MNRVKKVFEYTIQLMELLEKGSGIDRDKKIQLINELLKMREGEKSNLTPPYSAQEKELGMKLIDLNKQIALFLNNEKLLIQQDMKELHLKKESNKKYTNPYENLAIGGIFYDQQK